MIKNGSAIINASRGGVIDELALLDALNSGKISFAGLDTFEDEPIPKIKKDVLIIHDSFFEESYAPNTYLSNYFDLEYQRWSEDIDINSSAKNFDFVIIQSSIETFFEIRISKIRN